MSGELPGWLAAAARATGSRLAKSHGGTVCCRKMLYGHDGEKWMLYGGWRGHRRRTGVYTTFHGLFDSDAFTRAVVIVTGEKGLRRGKRLFVMRIIKRGNLIRWRKRCGNILILIKFIPIMQQTSGAGAMIW